MKTTIQTFFLVSFSFLQAQKLEVSFRTWVKGDVEHDNLDGKYYLSQIKDSSIVLGKILPERQEDDAKQEIPYQHIEKIRVRRHQVGLQRVLLGGLIGAGTGFIIGYAQGDERCRPNDWCFFSFSAEEKGLVNSVPGFLGGLIVGGICAKAKFGIPINRSYSVFNSKKSELDFYRAKKK